MYKGSDGRLSGKGWKEERENGRTGRGGSEWAGWRYLTPCLHHLSPRDRLGEKAFTPVCHWLIFGRVIFDSLSPNANRQD